MELSNSHKISQEKRDFKISDVLITAWSRVQVLPGPYEKRHPFGCLFCISRAFIPHPLRAAGSTGGVHITEHMIRWPFLFAPIAADPAFCRKLHQIPPFAQ